MKLLKWVLTVGLVLTGVTASAARVQAATDVGSSELQAAANIIVPNADSFGALKGYSPFSFDKKTFVNGGIVAHYQALLLADPWLTSELPELQLVVYAYSSQDAAEQAFEGLSGLSSFSNGQKTLLDSDSHTLYYQSNLGGSGVDVFGTVTAEYRALHYVERNGNLIFQSSVYRGNGVYDETNLQTFANAIAKTDSVKTILTDCVDNAKVAVGLLFPPSNPYWTSQSEQSSYDLSDSLAIPTHGTVSLKVYVSDAGAAVGTILDSSGLSTPVEGDLYLYINSAGRLFAGIYAPNFDADCDQEAGWYRLESASELYPYEWNSIDLHYGVGGFSVALNGVTEASCSVSQPRSASDLFLGDFPGDSIAESMFGYVDDLGADYSLTDSGQAWDKVLTAHLFLDLPDTDPDLPVFEYLKGEGVMIGSDGMLNPDAILDRAAMVKILLRAYNRAPDAGVLVPFSDVPIDAWYRKYIAKAYDVGMVKGHDNGTFLPGHEINRAEFFTMLYRLEGSKRLTYSGGFTDVAADDWYALGAAYAASKGVASGTTFDPTGVLTRRDAAKILYSLLK